MSKSGLVLGVAIVLVIILIGGAQPAAAQAPTPTDTPTATATWTNAERQQLSTIVPPPSCGNVYNPCFALPWAVPILPSLALPSPTLVNLFFDQFPTPVRTSLPTNTLAPGITPTVTTSPSATVATQTITYTPSPARLDTGPISTLAGDMSNVSGTLMGMGTAAVTLEGTEASIPELAEDLTTFTPNVFSTVRGVLAATGNKTMGLISFIFLVFVFVLLVQIFVLLMPVIVRIVEFVLNVINTFKPM